MGTLVDDDIRQVDNIASVPGAGDDGAHACHNLVGGEWFDHDVVGPSIERLRAVIEVILSGEDDRDRLDAPERTDNLVWILMLNVDDRDRRVEDTQQGLQVTATFLDKHVES
jgi:hypothetical protein